ncbi:flagellar biosynthesis protein FlhF [Dehalobacter sp. DCM]|uniref:flagellar biosynthesis protein FlhF n=1 Tax=Dehalobacter sp. DCM TaxID=2907827 RepID=UPI00308176C6|nr:flagellar biosynthesis protein FlhF [Dehalobacter sp. DCM]
MRVKRFVGDNVTDTMSKIKKDLGPEAVILQTRQIKEGGFLGFFARTKVEITAAIEEKIQPPLDIAAGLESLEIAEEHNRHINSDVIKKAYEAYRDKENENTWKNEAKSELTEYANLEIKEMHSILKEIKGHLDNTDYQIQAESKPYRDWKDYLTEQGISSGLSTNLLNQLKMKLSDDEWKSSDAVISALTNEVSALCTNTTTIRPRKTKTLVVAMVGPTGVGKTTTIGKLAAGFSIIERRKVALVTADTFRVAAVEQLRTFGEIIGVPVEVVMTPDSLKEAIDHHRDKELIFIDTAGRSPQHDLHMSELDAFLKKAQPDMTMLVTSVTTSFADQIKVFDKFKPIATHLILTKLDESYSLGSILDLLVTTNLPVAYLTNGQNVPDDIDAATSEKLTRYVLGKGIQNG